MAANNQGGSLQSRVPEQSFHLRAGGEAEGKLHPVGDSRMRESPMDKRRQGREKNRTGRKAEARGLRVRDTERRAALRVAKKPREVGGPNV